MIILTNHFEERYVERIVGIKDKREINEYIYENKDRIKECANKMFSRSQLVYSGCLGKDKIPKRFYIVDDIAIVLDNDEDKLITLYRIDFNFPNSNKTVIDDLVDEINKLHGKREIIVDKNFEKVNNLEEDIERIDEEIQILSEQIELYKSSKKMIADNIKCKTNELQIINSKIKSYAHQLLHWRDYRTDMNSID